MTLSVRAALLPLAVFAGIYGLVQLPADERTRALTTTASRLVSGEIYRPEILSRLVDRLGEERGACAGRLPRDVAIVRAALLDAALAAGDPDGIDAAAEQLDRAAQHAIACSPRDGFAWLARYRVRLQRSGPDDVASQALRNSFRFARNEGWVGLRRTRLVLTRSRTVPPDLVERSLSEFVQLLEAGYLDPCASLYAELSPTLRDRLMPRLEAAAPRLRTAFLSRLAQRGIDIPAADGVSAQPPWRPPGSLAD